VPPQAAAAITPPVTPPSAESPPIAVAPSPPQPPPPAFDPNERPTGPIENGSWEQKYLALQGRFQSEKRRAEEAEAQRLQLGEELMRTQEMLRPPNNQQPQRPKGYLTEKDLQDYGHDVLDLAQRAALHATAPELQRMGDENARLRQQIAEDRRRGLYQTLDAMVPDWRTIDKTRAGGSGYSCRIFFLGV